MASIHLNLTSSTKFEHSITAPTKEIPKFVLGLLTETLVTVTGNINKARPPPPTHNVMPNIVDNGFQPALSDDLPPTHLNENPETHDDVFGQPNPHATTKPPPFAPTEFDPPPP